MGRDAAQQDGQVHDEGGSAPVRQGPDGQTSSQTSGRESGRDSDDEFEPDRAAQNEQAEPSEQVEPSQQEEPNEQEGPAPTALPLIEPPRLRTGEDRSASRLELFFDLAYVLVVAELTGAFARDLTWGGAAVFAGLFTVIWWSWVTTTLYSNRFDTNDVPYRLAKLGQTFAIAMMAAAASTATTTGSVWFAAGYLVSQILLLALYARAYRHVPDARRTLSIYMGATGFGVLLWSVSLAVPGPARYILWGVGILVEATAPLLATRFGEHVPLHEEHLPERFGLFAMLVLGECVASVVVGLHDTEWRLASFTTAGIGFVITAALWWTYFDLGGAAGKHRLLEDDRPASGRHDRYVYGHLPLFIGLAAVGIGIEEYILHPSGALTTAGRFTLCAGVGLFLTGLVLVMAGTAARWSAAWPWPTVALPVVAAVSLLPLSPTLTALGLALVLAATVVVGSWKQQHGHIATTEP
ncbi:membrane protein [Kineosporia sp. NBRC 101677]|uniref:low temperature requirement protein A n=1 Tax=Kineosporia sp. NBRC 101677 TaxID=3032197 RepID=UPI0024A53E82|nr:low temperature requirement protein A [Kineosporia sp. NBRC 101677]GLY17213.1 membrane protein [Kineosporia sp. NBRC 101677]